MRVAWFSQLPGKNVHSLSAYCSQFLLSSLMEKIEIQAFDDQLVKEKPFSAHHYLTAISEHKKNPFDLFFYLLDDSPGSGFTRMHLGWMPGIMWAHNFAFENRGPISLADKHPDFDSPLGFRESRLTLDAIFSNDWIAREWRGAIPSRLYSDLAPSVMNNVIPIPVDSGWIEKGARRERALGFVGDVRVESRSHKLLQALKMLNDKVRLIWLVDNIARAKELLVEFGVSNVELVQGVHPENWREILSRVSAAAHLRFGFYGSFSPYLEMSLMAEVPTIISEHGPAQFFPEGIAFKVLPGDDEATTLAALIPEVLLMESAPPSREYAIARYSPSVIVKSLLETFEECKSKSKKALKRWDDIQMNARHEILKKVSAVTTSGISVFDERNAQSMKDLGWR